MNIALLIARVVLAVVFFVAGVTKLADLKGSRQALLDFGVPSRLAAPGGLLLPLAELAVAVALMLPVSAWWGALAALTLLLLFVAGIGYNLARGQHPDCHCFGQVYSRPIGWSTLLRNLILAGVAGFFVGFGRTIPSLSAFSWLSALTLPEYLALGGGLLLLALLVGEGWLIFAMLRQQGRLLLRLEELEGRMAGVPVPQPSPTEASAAPSAGLPVGTVAPGFALSGLYGETITLDFLRASGKPVLLLFSDPGCGPCSVLMPEVGRWQQDYADKLTVTLISRGSLETNRAKASEHGISQVLLQRDREISEAYRGRGTPGAVLVRPDGTIGSPLALGTDAIRALVAGAVGLPILQGVPLNGNGHGNGSLPIVKQPTPAVASNIGMPAPAFSLPDLSGKPVHLSDFVGSPTLLLFWNPGCGFCQRMLDDLKGWEANPPVGAPKLLLVSTGSIEANQALGLRSSVVLDQNMSVGSKFGANGTPMAVLVDAQGNVASELAIGAPAVMALAGTVEVKK